MGMQADTKTKKTIFILGAGFMQIPAIEAARELGLAVILSDGNPRAPAAHLADVFVSIDLKDSDALVDFALKQKQRAALDAVFTAATDFSFAVAKIAEACALPGHSPESALNASDKIRMRSCFQKALVPSPAFLEVHERDFSQNFSQIQASLPIAYPLVVKPVDNMGSRGCRLVQNKEALYTAVEQALLYSKSKRAILEEYMDGDEFSIDALVYEGEVYITGFADRHIFYPPYFVEMGHTMPTALSREKQEEIISVFKKGIKALGLSHGAAKGDIKYTKDGCKIGEIAARLSGGYMSGWTYPYASGISLTKLAIQLALGEKIPLQTMEKQFLPRLHSAERAWISIPGRLKAIHGMEEAQGIENVKAVFPRAKVHDELVFPTNNVEKGGNILSQAKTRKDAIEAAENAVASLFLELEENNAETEAFLSEDFLTNFPPSAFAALGKEAAVFLEKQKNEKPISVLSFINAIESKTAQKTEDFLPPFFQNRSVFDWNYKTIEKSLDDLAFFIKNNIRLENYTIPAYDFWQAFLRGGSQGLLYILQKKGSSG
jgi:biotin carboxylase